MKNMYVVRTSGTKYCVRDLIRIGAHLVLILSFKGSDTAKVRTYRSEFFCQPE